MSKSRSIFHVPSPVKMLEIYKVVPLLKKLPFDIECIFAYDDYLVIGTRQGFLLLYKISSNSKRGGEVKLEPTIQRSNKGFSKKPILQVEALPEFHVLICLSDQIVTVHNLDDYSTPLIKTELLTSKCRGALMFVTNVTKFIGVGGETVSLLRLCVALKRRLLIFYWKNNDFLELGPDLVIPDTPRSIAWVGESLCVGFRTEYILLKVPKGEQKGLITLGTRNTEPLVSAINSSKLLSLVQDDKSYILDGEGDPILDYDIPWTDFPQTIVDDMPYLLCLLPTSDSRRTTTNPVIEIQTMEPRFPVQKISDNSYGKIKQMVKCCNRRGLHYFATSQDIFALVAVSQQQQITLLLRENQFDLAKQLANRGNKKSRRPSNASGTSNASSPSKRDSSHSLPSICDSPDSAGAASSNNQEDTAKKIDRLHAFHLFCNKEFKESMNLFAKLDDDPTVVICLFPSLVKESARSKIEYPSPPPVFEGEDLKKGLKALEQYLLPIRQKLTQPDVVNNGRSKTDHAKLREIVDTSLLKVYLQTSNPLVHNLLRLNGNQCHLEETEEALIQFGKFHELITLYKSKGLHRKALDMLTEKCREERRNASMTTKHSSRSGTPTSLTMHERVIDYLQHLPLDHLPLLFEYSEWILQDYPEEGLKIFTEEFGSETEHIPRQEVIEFLERVNPSLVPEYLEHVIDVWSDESPAFHNLLIKKYRERINVLMTEYLSSHSGSEIKTVEPGKEEGELGVVRSKLLKFLKTSKSYTTDVLPALLSRDGLHHERALVEGRRGNDREALSIYIHEIRDPKAAEEYCNRVFQETGRKEVFTTLLKLILSLKQPDDEDSEEKSTVSSHDSSSCRDHSSGSSNHHIRPDLLTSTDDASLFTQEQNSLSNAISIMNKYSVEVDPVEGLNLLPKEDVCVKSIQAFLEKVTVKTLSDRKKGQLHRHLLLSQNLQVKGTRIRLQQINKVVIEDSDLCRVCQKRIGRSAFLRYPNAHLVHYSCKDRYNE